MDNDNKINSVAASVGSVHKEVALLLENELNRIAMDGKREPFSIEEEFSKTKENDFPFMWQNMWLRLLICFGVVFSITVFLVLFVSNSNRGIKVEVNEFNSLNLSTLLNKVNDIDQKIQELENAKKSAEEQRDAEIERIEGVRAAALKSLAAMNVKNRVTRTQMEQQIEQTYRADLASVEKYNKFIANYNEELKLYTDQRNQFDAERVQEAERQKAIINSERFLHEKEKEKLIFDYEARLEDSRNLLKQTQAEDLKRQEQLLAFTINQYDPPVAKDNSAARSLIQVAKNYTDEYTGAVYEGIEMPLSEEASEEFRDIFETQRDLYDSIAEISVFFDQFPFKDENAVASFVRSMKRYAYTAGNQISVASVSEVNRLIAEKKSVENNYEHVYSGFNEFLEAICSEPLGKNTVSGVIAQQTAEFGTEVYIAQSKRSLFTSPEYQDCVFPCTVWRGKDKVAIGFIAMTDGVFSLYNLSFGGGLKLKTGDRIVMGEPVHQKEKN
ncbi:hypothetical protein [Treponema sp.]|uniref:hypothetical protein n=1 Tax=Treponema sp. TaxID=166 RepID=UPI003F0EB45F